MATSCRILPYRVASGIEHSDCAQTIKPREGIQYRLISPECQSQMATISCASCLFSPGRWMGCDSCRVELKQMLTRA
jgi:hypothetical protein